MSQNVENVISLSRVLPIIFYLRGQLLNRADYLRLISSKDLSDLTMMLKEKSYKDISTTASDSSTGLEKRIREYNVKNSFRLANSAPLPVRVFLQAYLSKPVYLYFALILKTKIDAGISLPPPREIDSYIWNRIRVAGLMEKIIQAKNVQELENVTKNSPDYREAIAEAMKLYWKHGFLYMVDLAFAKSYFEKVYNTLVEVPSPDMDDIHDILGIETDAYNVMAIWRAKNWGFSEDIPGEFIVPHFFGINEKTLRRLIGSNTEESIRLVMESKYGHRFLKREGLAYPDFELEFRRIEARECWKILLGNPFNYAQVFAIIRLIDIENQNLLAVIHGKDGKLASERILQYVIAENPNGTT